jgi:hypothetical protein
MRVVLFLLDAFRNDYISEEVTPFIWKCTREGRFIKHVIPSAGFCERTEIFSGLKPNESGFFTAIGYDPEKSPYKKNRLVSFLGRIENIFGINRIGISKTYLPLIYRKVILKLLRNRVFGEKLKPYNIPFSFLQYFNLTEDEFEFEKLKFPGRESLLDIVERKKKATFFEAFTSLGKPSNGTDYDRISLALSASKDDNNLFLPIYISAIDSWGHKFGPHSDDLRSKLTELDEVLKRSVSDFQKVDESTQFIFLGDHGMTEVKKNLDVKSALLELGESLKLKPGKDYIYFLDSTILRVWFISDKARDNLKSGIQGDKIFQDNGTIINAFIAEKYSIPIDDRRYGDLIWWANEGVLIFPDFFHNSVPHKGMHGYNPETPSAHGTCLLYGNGLDSSYSERMNLNEVYYLISELLES